LLNFRPDSRSAGLVVEDASRRYHPGGITRCSRPRSGMVRGPPQGLAAPALIDATSTRRPRTLRIRNPRAWFACARVVSPDAVLGWPQRSVQQWRVDLSP
jgi:hypothetical protein